MIKVRGEFKPRQSAPKSESDRPPQFSFSLTWFSLFRPLVLGLSWLCFLVEPVFSIKREMELWQLKIGLVHWSGRSVEMWVGHGQSLLKAAAVTKSQHATKMWPFPVASLSTRRVLCPPSYHKYLLSYVNILERHSNNLQLSNLKHLFSWLLRVVTHFVESPQF